MDSGAWAPEHGSELGSWQRAALADLAAVGKELIAQDGITARQAFRMARWAGYSGFEAGVIARHVKLAGRGPIGDKPAGPEVVELEDGSFLVKKSGAWGVVEEKMPQDWRDPAAGDGRVIEPSSSPFYSTSAGRSTEWGDLWKAAPAQQP